MESLFKPGKWLVLFCAAFLLVWMGLQYVANDRLKKEAEIIGKQIFTWTWPGEFTSSAQITDVSVVQKTDKDAVVMVKGQQQVITEQKNDHGTNTLDCTARLTFYKMSGENPKTKKIEDYWILGQVDFPEVE
jgi:hypothetical protein